MKGSDLKGQRFGMLTAVEPTAERKNGFTMWRCRCDCGKELLIESRHLKRGTITDCGCITKVKPWQRDLTGKRFGKLVCVEPTEQRGYSGSIVWRCVCDCGNTCLVPSTQLTKGYKKSCGCLSHPELKDYVGKRFGKLVVQDYAGKRDGMHRWRCKCDCGSETVVGQTLLQSGKTKSCGCLVDLLATRHFVDGTCLEIIRSQKLLSSNTSGVRGVYLNKKTGKWVAQITLKGKTYYLGTFASIEEAARARKKAAERMFGEILEEHADLLSKKTEKTVLDK